MKNNISINRNERLFDSIIEIAAEEAMMQRLADLPSREELDEMYPASKELQSGIDKIIAREGRSVKRGKLAKAVMKAAACIGVLFIVCGIALMSIEASRIVILNTIISIRQDYVLFEFSRVAPNGAGAKTGQIINFEYMGSQDMGSLVISIFENEYGEQITLQQSQGESISIGVGTEHGEFTTAFIGEQEVYLLEASSEYHLSFVMWVDSGAVYLVSAGISIEELLTFAAYMIDG